MKVSEMMVTDVFTLTPEDTIAKAFSMMGGRSVNQIPVVDEDGKKYLGMIFAKQLTASTRRRPSPRLRNPLQN